MAKSGKSMTEKFKSFFKSGGKAPTVSSNNGNEFSLTNEMILELSPDGGGDTQARMKLIKELLPIFREQPLQEVNQIELIWYKTRDLLQSDSLEQRADMYSLYQALVRGQYAELGIRRGYFFDLIKQSSATTKRSGTEVIKCRDPDLIPRILLLDALTSEGKEVTHFETEIGPLLKRFFPHINDISSQAEPSDNVVKVFLRLLLNVIKFNCSYLDEDTITEWINQMSHMCLITVRPSEDIEGCLKCLDVIVRYAYIPREALRVYVFILCIVVNMEIHAAETWRITKNLMGTHLGHSALYTMCQIIQGGGGGDVALLRGAIFFVGMSLWGNQRIDHLDSYSPMTILPTFLQASLACTHHLVLYEITLQTERLVTKFGPTLRATGCDAVLALLEILLDVIPANVDLNLQPSIVKHIHNIISCLENLAVEKRYVGSQHRLYEVVEKCSSHRPESSVIRLIDFRSNEIYPTKRGWLQLLYNMMQKHYLGETRVTVRKRALEVMMVVFKSNRQIYEEEILKEVVMPFLHSVDQESCLPIRLEVIKALTTICSEGRSAKKCGEALDLLERLAMKTKVKVVSEDDDAVIAETINGLVKVINVRICHQPSSIIVRAVEILVNYLETNYVELPELYVNLGRIREQIFTMLMSMRTDDNYHLGIENNLAGGAPEKVVYSPFLVCQPQTSTLAPGHEGSLSAAQTKTGVTYMSMTRACMMVILCLTKERDWQVLKLVLSRVSNVLQNKAMIVRYGKKIQEFVLPLIKLTHQNSPYPECLINVGGKLSKTEFNNNVYPVLAAMAPYNEYLSADTKRPLVNALQNGLLSRESNRICIMALTACALEMKASMRTLISNLLLNLSKISATKSIATPMLEFLSTLIRLPELFNSFIDTNYMSVFAITLPYTNPLRFDEYTVALAHHVIVMWFLKCRLAFRQNFVQFIISGLNNNVLINFEEGEFRKPALTMAGGSGKSRVQMAASNAAAKVRGLPSSASSTSSDNRPRSSSFSTESLASGKSVPVKERHPTGNVNSTGGSAAPEAEQKMNKRILFHQELSETCIDFLARYMFANPSVQPKRLPTAEFLLKGGQSASWILGTMIITVTTSICDQTSTRSTGFCDRCHLVCKTSLKTSAASAASTLDPQQTQGVEQSDPDRRRHMSEATGSRKVDSDDSLIKGGNGRPEMCACWCSGWAEIHVRRPSGDTSWMCRIQNSSLVSESFGDVPVADLSSLFHSSLESSAAAISQPQPTTTPSSQLPSEEKDSTCGSQAAVVADLPPNNDVGQVNLGPQRESTGQTSIDEIRRGSLQATSTRSLGMTDHHLRLDRRSSMVPTAMTASENMSENNKAAGGSKMSMAAENSAVIPEMRDRAHTVSGHSPRPLKLAISAGGIGRPGGGNLPSTPTGSGNDHKPERVTGISPQFVFLTLYHSNGFGSCANPSGGASPSPSAAAESSLHNSKKPLLIPSSKTIEMSIKSLDRIHAHETHKIGVIYIGKGQPYEEEVVLKNQFGSLRYVEFLHGLGNLISLKEVAQEKESTTFLGGLSADDGDGDYTYLWEDDVMQVVFHVATMMPNRESDPKCNKKKRHIGNNFVTIVYNDRGVPSESYEFSMIKGQFNYACIVVTPIDQGSNRVEIKCRPELNEPLGHVKEPKTVSDRNLAILVRQMALHCNLSSYVQQSLGSKNRDPYASSWLERLRAIKRIRGKVLKELEAGMGEKGGMAGGGLASGPGGAGPSGAHETKSQPAANDFTITVLRRKETGDNY